MRTILLLSLCTIFTNTIVLLATQRDTPQPLPTIQNTLYVQALALFMLEQRQAAMIVISATAIVLTTTAALLAYTATEVLSGPPLVPMAIHGTTLMANSALNMAAVLLLLTRQDKASPLRDDGLTTIARVALGVIVAFIVVNSFFTPVLWQTTDAPYALAAVAVAVPWFGVIAWPFTVAQLVLEMEAFGNNWANTEGLQNITEGRDSLYVNAVAQGSATQHMMHAVLLAMLTSMSVAKVSFYVVK